MIFRQEEETIFFIFLIYSVIIIQHFDGIIEANDVL